MQFPPPMGPSPWTARLAAAALSAVLGGVGWVGEAHGDGLDPGLAMAPVSGSRLVPVFLTGEDESRQFVGWFDRSRGENCAFALSGDGVVRCLPSDALEARLFADASCKQRMVALTGCTKPKYVVETDGACTVETRHRVHDLGARVRPAAVYSDASGVCSRSPADASTVYVMVGREVPPAAFVAAKYAIGRPGLGLKTEYDVP